MNILCLHSSLALYSILQPDMGKKSKYKTSVKKKTLNPEFNEVKHVSSLTAVEQNGLNIFTYSASSYNVNCLHRSFNMMCPWTSWQRKPWRSPCGTMIWE